MRSTEIFSFRRLRLVRLGLYKKYAQFGLYFANLYLGVKWVSVWFAISSRYLLVNRDGVRKIHRNTDVQLLMRWEESLLLESVTSVMIVIFLVQLNHVTT